MGWNIGYAGGRGMWEKECGGGAKTFRNVNMT